MSDVIQRTRELYHKFSTDEIAFLQAFVRIVDESGKLVPFRLKNRPMQEDFVKRILRKRVTRAIELKARRVGGTSLFMGLGVVRCHLRRNYHVLLLAQSDPDAKRFMKEGFHAYWENMITQVEMPDGSLFYPRLDLGQDNDERIDFPKTGSSITTATAGSVKMGRGQGYDMVIGTEVARWDVGRPPGTAEETWAMAIGSQRDRPDPFAVQESTAYGAAGFFYETYQAAKRDENGYTPLFYDWRWHPVYAYSEGDMRAKESERGEITLNDDEIRMGLTIEQARWRRTMSAELGPAMFYQEYPEDDETCFRVSGDPYFDIDTIDRAIQGCRPCYSVTESGALRIWQPPRVGERYIIGVDPGGEGVDRRYASQERDYDAVTVFDSRMQHVATLHGRWDTQTLAGMVVDLARYYNFALIVPEAGPYGDHVISVMGMVLGYKNIYYEKDPNTGKVMGAGKKTGPASKPAMLETLKDVVEHNILRSDDKKFWSEMRNFHRVPTISGRLKLEARAGHDDLVISAALAAWAWSEGFFGRGSRFVTRAHLPGRPAAPRQRHEYSEVFTDTKQSDLLKRLEVAS